MHRHRRENRRKRRQIRDEQASRTMMLYSTAAIFGASALLISFARIPFKFSTISWIPSVDLFLIGAMLTVFGMLFLLVPFLQRTKITTGALILAITLGASVWFANRYVDLTRDVRVETAAHPANPLGVSFPTAKQKGFLSADHAPFVALTTDRAMFGTFDSYQVTNRTELRTPQELESVLEEFRKRRSRELQMIGRVERGEPLVIAIDRCEPFERFVEYAEQGDPSVVSVVMTGSEFIGLRRFHLRPNATKVPRQKHEQTLIYQLSSEGINVFVDGSRVKGESECADAPTICASKQSEQCGPNWDQTDLEMDLKTRRPIFEKERVTIAVTPDVPMQQVLSLVDELMFSDDKIFDVVVARDATHAK